jgi:hypothetical protein
MLQNDKCRREKKRQVDGQKVLAIEVVGGGRYLGASSMRR